MLKIKSEQITEKFTHDFTVTINTEGVPIVGTLRGVFKRLNETEFKELQAEAQKATNGLLNIRRDSEDEEADRVDIGAMDAIQDKVIAATLLGIIGVQVDDKELSPQDGKEWAFKSFPFSFRGPVSDAFFSGYRGSKARNAKK